LASNVAALFIPGAIVKVEEIPKLGSGKTNYPALNELARTMTEAAL
jgi:acyl-coenzyme A synthetase/AMP-(fatty) acid ligase